MTPTRTARTARTARTMLRRGAVRGLAAALLALVAATGTPAFVPSAAASVETVPSAHYLRGPCDANDNLGEIANNFISRCRKGSIRQVFPGEHYGDTLGEIKDCGTASCKTAWKLLNDNRFKK